MGGSTARFVLERAPVRGGLGGEGGSTGRSRMVIDISSHNVGLRAIYCSGGNPMLYDFKITLPTTRNYTMNYAR